MIRLLAHLWADYVFQPDKWATEKSKNLSYAMAHAMQYGLIFWIVCMILGLDVSSQAMAFIVLTHAIIDRFYPARHLAFAKNWIADRTLKWNECKATGYEPSKPAYLSVWLMIVLDNTMHLTINYAAIKWL